METVGPHRVTLDVMRPAAWAPTLSGRAEERTRLLEVVRAGLEGSPRTVLVHGEAGIGKTSLVRNVCDGLTREDATLVPAATTSTDVRPTARARWKRCAP